MKSLSAVYDDRRDFEDLRFTARGGIKASYIFTDKRITSKNMGKNILEVAHEIIYE